MTMTGRRGTNRAAFAPAVLRPASLKTWRRRAVATVVAVIFSSASVLACPLCFGAEETGVVDATRWGILALLGITLVVQGAFAGFFLYLRSRARHIADVELDIEWSKLQGGASRS